MSKNKKSKRNTIGKMTNTRGVWHINPVTRVKQGKSKHYSRSKAKQLLKSGRWDEF